MSPAYTGSKMKNMLPFVIESAEQTINFLKKQFQERKVSGNSIVMIFEYRKM